MTPTSALLDVKGLSLDLGGRRVLSSVDMSLSSGDALVVVGPSGSGKTTLLKTLDLLLVPDSGEIRFDGEAVFSAGAARPSLAARGLAWMTGRSAKRGQWHVPPHSYRQKIGVVFQEYNLWPHLTLAENIAAPLRWNRAEDSKDTPAKVLCAAQQLQIEGLLRRYPAQVSGGERQRAALARALVVKPRLLLLDEITAALDPELVSDLLNVVLELREVGFTMVVVTHHIRFARRLGTHAAFMIGGRIHEYSTAETFFERPSTPELSSFLGHFGAL